MLEIFSQVSLEAVKKKACSPPHLFFFFFFSSTLYAGPILFAAYPLAGWQHHLTSCFSLLAYCFWQSGFNLRPPCRGPSIMPAPQAGDSPQNWAVQFPPDQPGSSFSPQRFLLSYGCSSLNHLTLSHRGCWHPWCAHHLRKPRCPNIYESCFA